MELTIEQALQRAVEDHKAGKLQDAEVLYRAILQAQPKHPDANHNLGVLAVSVNKAEFALPLFKAALEANPRQEQFWLSYIHALIKEKQFDNARNVLSRGKESGLAGEKVDALNAQLTTSLLMPNSDLSSSQINLNQARIPKQVEVNTLLEHYQQGRYDLAETLAKEITHKYPGDQLGWIVLGALFGQAGRLQDSLIAYKRALEISPNNAELNNNLGSTLNQLGRLEDAEASYNKAISIKPEFALAHNNLGITQQELGRLEDAERSHRKAIVFKPEYAEAYYYLGNTLKALGRLDDAETTYRKAIDIKPEFTKAHSNLGSTLLELGRFEDAEASYNKAIEIKPDYVIPILGRAMLSNCQNKIDDSIKYLTKIIETNKGDDFLMATVKLAVLKFLADDLYTAKLLIESSKEILQSKNISLQPDRHYHIILDKHITWHNSNKYPSNNHIAKRLHVIGESNALASNRLFIEDLKGGSLCKVYWIAGCKQWHLGHSSRNHYKEQFERVLRCLPYESTILLSIGEIDCRIDDGILRHIKNHPSKIHTELMKSTIDNYLVYVYKITKIRSIDVIIQGIPCPNIDLEKVEKNDLSMLIDFIKKFNLDLSHKSKKMGFEFLDLHTITDRGDGYSNSVFHIDEHHLSPAGMLEAWRRH
jgi:tetratricopeptide (TPR) repeat protein